MGELVSYSEEGHGGCVLVHPSMSKTEFARGGAVQGICRAGLYLQYCFLRAKQMQDTARHISQPISFKRTLKRTRMSKILAMNKGTCVAGDTRATCHLHTRRFSRIPILNFSLNPIPPVFWGSVMRKTFLKHDSRFPPFRWKQGFHLRDLVPVSAFQCSTGIPGGINI